MIDRTDEREILVLTMDQNKFLWKYMNRINPWLMWMLLFLPLSSVAASLLYRSYAQLYQPCPLDRRRERSELLLCNVAVLALD